MVLACIIGGPVLPRRLGHGPNAVFASAVPGYTPVGFWTHVHTNSYGGNHGPTTLFVLGADSTVGRDELMRLLDGGQVTIEVAVGATILAMLLGTTLGVSSAGRPSDPGSGQPARHSRSRIA